MRDEVKSCSDRPDEAWAWLNEVYDPGHRILILINILKSILILIFFNIFSVIFLYKFHFFYYLKNQ